MYFVDEMNDGFKLYVNLLTAAGMSTVLCKQVHTPVSIHTIIFLLHENFVDAFRSDLIPRS